VPDLTGLVQYRPSGFLYGGFLQKNIRQKFFVVAENIAKLDHHDEGA